MELRRVNDYNSSPGQGTEVEEEGQGEKEEGQGKNGEGDHGKGQEGEEEEQLNEDLSIGIDAGENYNHNGATLQVSSEPYPDQPAAGFNRLDEYLHRVCNVSV